MKKLWKSLTPRLHFLPICSGRKIHQHQADPVHTKSFIGGVQFSGRAFDCKILHLKIQREIAVTDKKTWNEARKETLRDRHIQTG